MRTLIIAAILGSLLCGPAALAQPAGTDEPGLTPAPPVARPAPPVMRPAPRERRGTGRHQLHAYLMAHDPAYRSARRMRLAGILVSAIGGGIGAAVTVIGLAGVTWQF